MENTKELVSTGARGRRGRGGPAEAPAPEGGERRGLSCGRELSDPRCPCGGRRFRSVWEGAGDTPGCCGGRPRGVRGIVPALGGGSRSRASAAARGGSWGAVEGSGQGTWGWHARTPLLRPGCARSGFVLPFSFLLPRGKVSASRGRARIRFSPCSTVVPDFSNFFL